MEANFICCICHKVPSNVVESACCHSLFCWDCVVEKAAIQACPACFGELNPETCTENLAVKKIIEGINVKCSFSGCYETMSASARSAHEATCPKGSTLCPNSELCGIIERGNVTTHLLTCQFRRILCHKCDVPLPLPQLMDHLDNSCMEVVVECPNLCRTSLLRKNIVGHIADYCPNAEAECPFAEYGCTIKPTRATIDSHLSESLVHHMSLTVSTIRNQQNQINTLREQLVATQEAVSSIPSDNSNNNKDNSTDSSEYNFHRCRRNSVTLGDIVTDLSSAALYHASHNVTVNKAVMMMILFAIFSRLFLPFFIVWVLIRIVKWIVVVKVGVAAYRRVKHVPLHRVHPAKVILASVATVVVLPWIYYF